MQISIHAPREGCDATDPVAQDMTEISIHAPREGCDSMFTRSMFSSRKFQSTHPARGATVRQGSAPAPTQFQPTHPARGATRRASFACSVIVFQPTHPARGATGADFVRRLADGDFNPRTPRGVRRSVSHRYNAGIYFNPRTPRGVRPDRYVTISPKLTISTHAPREGCDMVHGSKYRSISPFQPTHPARGATDGMPDASADLRYFNPRTPRGVRPARALPVESIPRFQPTHPARGATFPCTRYGSAKRHFNPRTPRGVRRVLVVAQQRYCAFQPTHPARGATGSTCRRIQAGVISTHAPREGCDRRRLNDKILSIHFNPRTPRGVRHESNAPINQESNFNPRTPRGVRHGFPAQGVGKHDFNPRTPRGVRQGKAWLVDRADNFNPRTPRGVRLRSCRPPGLSFAHFNPRTPRGVRPP